MGRIITAGVVGAIVYYVWGTLVWTVIPLHLPTMHGMPDEKAMVQAVTAQELETGVYTVPFAADPAEMSDPESSFSKSHTSGPIFTVFYQQEGSVPMNSGMMLVGFLIDLAATLLAACLLASIGGCGRNYWCRVGFVAALGIFLAIMAHVSYWNWMYFPLDFTVAFIIDVVVGWSLVGLVMAAIVRPKLETPSAADATPTKSDATPAASPSPPPASPTPVRNDAISLLATLQREARFIDIVKEPLESYTDAQVGAAARDVLRDCGVVLDRLFQLQPVVDREEGDQVEIPANVDSAEYRISGSASGSAITGSLVHHGCAPRSANFRSGRGARVPRWLSRPRKSR